MEKTPDEKKLEVQARLAARVVEWKAHEEKCKGCVIDEDKLCAAGLKIRQRMLLTDEETAATHQKTTG